MWQDHRGLRLVKERIGGRVSGYAPAALAAWVRKTGGVPAGNDPIGHMLNIALNYPEVAAATRWYLEPVDYLSMRFTGIAAASHASMTAAWLTDNRQLDHLEYDPELVRRGGVDATKLPPLVATGSVIGGVRAEVAADLGIPAGVPVVTGVPDLHAAAVGAGTDPRLRAAHGVEHDVVDRHTGAVQEDRRAPRHGRGARASAAAATCWPTTTTPRACRCSGCATRSSRRTTGSSPVKPAASTPSPRWPAHPRRAPDGCSSRHGSRASARRSPTATPAAASTTSRSRRRAPTSCARSWRAWRTTTSGCTPTSRSSPSAGSTRSASSAAARPPTSGARSMPT